MLKNSLESRWSAMIFGAMITRGRPVSTTERTDKCGPTERTDVAAGAMFKRLVINTFRTTAPVDWIAARFKPMVLTASA